MQISDYIEYRIPGEAPVLKKGMFRLLPEGEVPEGFVVSDFEGNKVYQFVEGAHDGTQSKGNLIQETSKSAYMQSAANFVDALKANGGKAVLSRIKKVEAPKDLHGFFTALCDAYPNAFVYTFLSSNIGVWIGATPETLLQRNGSEGRTMALAGTRLAGSNELWLEKEFEEHELVADFIESTLKTEGIDRVQRSERHEIESGPVKHLHTAFSFELNKAEGWKLALKLHPTPAVSGWPVNDSLKLIRENELHDRAFYAGIIGVTGANSRLFVNLRCAQITGNDMFLYLGGGFTKDSDPEAEWEETENKAKTLLDVLKKK